MHPEEHVKGRGRHRRSGQPNATTRRRAAFSRAIEALEPRRLLSTTVDFESLSIGPIGDTTGVYDDPSGFRFALRTSGGAAAGHQSQVYGTPQGFPSKVLHPREWGQQFVVSRTDGGSFDLASFDYAASRYGDAGDFVLTGFFEGGSSQQQTVSFTSSKSPQTLELNWEDLTSVRIAFAGGVNNAYGALDNFDFDAASQPAFQFFADRVVVEAEQFDASIPRGEHSWQPVAGGVDGAMQALPDTQAAFNSNIEATSPRLDYAINFPAAGEYIIWIRGKAVEGDPGNSDTLHVGLNGVVQPGADRMTGFGTDWTWSADTIDQTGSGIEARFNVPSAGVHTVNLYVGEDGLAVDRFFVSASASGLRPMFDSPGPRASERPTGGTTSDPATVTGSLADPDPLSGPAEVAFDGRNHQIAGVEHLPRGSIAPLPDGRFYLFGRSTATEAGGPTTRYVTRHFADGALDTSFADNGRRVLDVESPLVRGPAFPQSGGGFIVWNEDSGGPNLLYRYDANLQPDTSFGGGDGVIAAGTYFDIAPNGQIVTLLLSGEQAQWRRYDAAGNVLLQVDGDAPHVGAALPHPNAQAPYYGTVFTLFDSMEVLDDGSVIVVLEHFDYHGLRKFNADFTPNMTYAGDGVADLDMYDVDSRHEFIEAGPDGRIIVSERDVDGEHYATLVAPDGTITAGDEFYWANGLWPLTSYANNQSARFHSDGDVSLAYTIESELDPVLERQRHGFGVDRFNPDGTRDDSFESFDFTAPQFGDETLRAVDTGLLADGTFIVAANAGSDALLWRISTGDDSDSGFDDIYGPAIAFAEGRLAETLGALTPDQFFNFTDAVTGEWGLVNGGNWAAGFTPGMAWSLHELTGDAAWAQLAEPFSETLADWSPLQEDVGYRMMPGVLPYYQWLRDEGRFAESEGIFDRMLESVFAKDLRWNETVGAYETTWRPSDSGDPRANYGVLIDQTFDLTLLWWAAEQLEAQDAAYAEHLRGRVLRHAETVADHLVRADGSTFQWGYFDESDGSFISGETYQGYADDSTWARGQAWAMLSFAELALATGDVQLTQTAAQVADWFLDHLPADKVPFWDFDAPDIPETYRDSSAAAIAASALMRLSSVPASQLSGAGLAAGKADEWRGGAQEILGALIGPEYLAVTGPEQSLLRHGAGNVPNTGVADNGLPYGDYFFLDALALLQDWYSDDTATVVVDFESAAVGQIPSGIYTEDGFTFFNRPGSGGTSLQPLIIHGPAQGYASKVLSTTNWARRIDIQKEDGGAFELARFDYAAGRWGEAGDFVLTGYFAGGGTDTRTIPFSSKQLTTLELGWEDLELVSVNFAGGVNSAYGSVDNFVFGSDGQEDQPPTTTGSLNDPDPVAGPVRIQFDGRSWNEVHALLPLADGSFFVIGASGVEPADPAGETAPVTRQDPTEVMHYITRHFSDGSIDTSWRQDGRDAVPAELQPLIGLKLFGVPEQYVQPLGDGMLVRPAGGDLMRFDDQLNRDMSFGDNGVVPGGAFTTIPGAGFAVLSGGVLRVYDAGGTELRNANVNEQILPLLFDGSEVQVRRIGDLGADAEGHLYVGVTNIATGFDEQDPDQVPFAGAARFLPTLQLDTSYGRQGISRESVSDLEDETHRSLFVNDDGRVLLGINESDGDRNVIFFDAAGADGAWVRYGAISEVWGAVFLEDGEVAFVVQEQEPEFNALVRDAYGFRVVLARPAGDVREIARFDDDEVPRQMSGAFTASDGTFVLGGFQEDLELNGSGFPVDIDHQATLWRVAVPTEQLITVDFESAAVGQIASGLYTEDGFTFSNRPGSGGTSLEPLIVHGPAQGYASKVLSTTNWARRIDVVRDGGGSFDLSSFDYAAGRWGEAGDFLLTGYFTDGSTQAQSVAFSSKSLSTLDLDWEELERISINFAGGVNSAYGSVDNFRFVI